MYKTICYGTILAFACLTGVARADDDNRGNSAACKDLPGQGALRTALKAAQSVTNGGFGLNMWATVVNRDGLVCAVAFTGTDRGDQWPGSRVISAQKANTANAFSLPGLASAFHGESLQRRAAWRQPLWAAAQ